MPKCCGRAAGWCVCVCVLRKLTLLQAAFTAKMWDKSTLVRLHSDWRQISFGAAVDAAVNSQYLQLLTAWAEAQQAKCLKMFKKKWCVQGRWEVSEDGETCIQSLLPSADEIFRTRVQSSPDVVCVFLLSVIICYFVVRYKLCDLWSHRPLKPTALQINWLHFSSCFTLQPPLPLSANQTLKSSHTTT